MLREELNQVTERLKINNDKQADLRVEEGELETQRNSLVRQIILEEKILAGTEWEVRLSANGDQLFLDYYDNFDSVPINQIKNLCWQGWHSDFALDPDFAHQTENAEAVPSKYEIHFDDTRVTIWFDNPVVITEFIKRYQIKLVNTSLPGVIARAKIELETLQGLEKLVQE